MKSNMTIEEKAKAYDEALKQAKFYHGNCPSEPEKKKLEKMFPVLCESRDEQIRKFLVGEFERRKDGWAHPDISIEDILAWLDRHKEDIENIPLNLETDDEENRDLANNAIGFINIGACYLNNRCRDEVVKWLKSVPDTIKYLEYAVERLRKRLKNQNIAEHSVELTDDVVLGLDRALMIVKDAKGVLPAYQSDDGIYECNHAIETLENILKTIQ